MPKNNKPPTRVALDDSLDGRQRIRAMLSARGYTIASWARSRGIVPEEVHHMLGGLREYSEIRAMMCADLGLTPEQLQALIPPRLHT